MPWPSATPGLSRAHVLHGRLNGQKLCLKNRVERPERDLTLAFLCCSGSERASICAAACFDAASPLVIILAIRWTSA